MDSSSSSGRTQVQVKCTRCNVDTTVPFNPTPGRPVYCRECYMRRPATPARGPAGSRSPARGAGGRFGFNRPAPEPRKRMLAMGRKGHFVYDMREVLAKHETVDENQRRMFIEMLFTRGSRQGVPAAKEFLDEKVEDSTIAPEEAERMSRLLDKYSQYR